MLQSSGHKNLKEWISSSRVRGLSSEGKVGHEEEDPGSGKRHKEEKGLVGYMIVM